MPIYMIGEGARQGPPFNRTFFQAKLGDILSRASSEQKQRLTLFLTDGMTLEVCEILELEDQYMTLRAYRGSEEACDVGIHVIPYGVVYRMELAREEDQRVGFNWMASREKSGRRGRKGAR